MSFGNTVLTVSANIWVVFSILFHNLHRTKKKKKEKKDFQKTCHAMIEAYLSSYGSVVIYKAETCPQKGV